MATSPDLVRLLSEGKISRREFVTRVTAMGAAIAIPGLIASADALAATPKQGGRLRVALSGSQSNENLDPGFCCTAYSGALQYQLRDTLVDVDARYRPVPVLATEWEATNGPQQWTFKLRDGVEFHSGRTLTSQDVRMSMDYHRGEDSKSPVKPLFAQVVEIKTPDKSTVVFDLEGPNADFPALLSDYHMQIMPGDLTYEEWATSGQGTGPFVLEAFEPGIRTHTKRNPNYWNEGKPHFDEIEMLAIADVNSRTSALQTGTVDVINQPDPKTVHLLDKQPGLQVINVGSPRHNTMAMRCDTPPLDNNDLRLALKYSIPREEILQKVSGGFGTVGNDHPISPLHQYHAAELPQRVYDPDKATFHLKKSGHSDYVFELHAADAGFAGSVDAAVLVQHGAEKAGLNVTVVRMPNDGYWTNVWLNKPLGMYTWFGRTTEDMMFSTAYAAGAEWNDSFWTHERFNVLLVQARGELNTDLRREMYFEMQQICRDEGGVVVLNFLDTVAAATDKLKFNEPLRGNFELDGFNFSKDWWFG